MPQQALTELAEDLKPIERSTLTDLDPIPLNNFIIKLQTEKPKLANLEKNEILKLQGIAIDSKPTVAGIMIFGKYPQGFFPQLAITAIVVKSLEAYRYCLCSPQYESSNSNRQQNRKKSRQRRIPACCRP